MKTRRQLLKESLVALLFVLRTGKAKESPISKVNWIESNKTFTDLYGDHLNNVVVFGNPDNTKDFEAHVKMQFWGEDTICLSEESIKGEPTVEGEVVTLDLPTRKLQWFKGDRPKWGSIHWVEVLKEKPLSNKWSLKIADAGQFKYCYQTPFAEVSLHIPGSRIEYIEANGVEHIRLIYPEGGLVEYDERPLDVDGSIAVYHKTKRDHCIGGKNYRTGKVLHIPRPKAVDENGKWVWCDIQVKDDIYTRTIPQSFLDSAAYPVIINDTFGYWSSGATTRTTSAKYQYANYKGSPASDGSATSMSFYGCDRGAGSNPTLGIFAENTGVPGNLLRDTGAITVDDTVQWWSDDLDSPLDILATSEYWLGLNSDPGVTWYADTDSQDSYYQEDNTYTGGTLISFSSPSEWWTNYIFSIYLTYTPSAAEGGQVIIVNTN